MPTLNCRHTHYSDSLSFTQNLSKSSTLHPTWTPFFLFCSFSHSSSGRKYSSSGPGFSARSPVILSIASCHGTDEPRDMSSESFLPASLLPEKKAFKMDEIHAFGI